MRLSVVFLMMIGKISHELIPSFISFYFILFYFIVHFQRLSFLVLFFSLIVIFIFVLIWTGFHASQRHELRHRFRFLQIGTYVTLPDYYAVPCQTMLSWVMLRYAMPCYTLPYYIMLCYAIPSNAVLCCVMPCSATLCHALYDNN